MTGKDRPGKLHDPTLARMRGKISQSLADPRPPVPADKALTELAARCRRMAGKENAGP